MVFPRVSKTKGIYCHKKSDNINPDEHSLEMLNVATYQNFATHTQIHDMLRRVEVFPRVSRTEGIICHKKSDNINPDEPLLEMLNVATSQNFATHTQIHDMLRHVE